MIEKCATIAEALASIRSLEELEAFSAGLRRPGAKPVTPEEMAAIARRKIEMARKGG